MDRPKLMFKIELVDTDVVFTLLTVMNNDLERKSNFYFTDDNWAVYYGKKFSISRSEVISLPTTPKRETSKVYFNTDAERREFLKNMAFALEEWSNSHLFKGVNEKPEIRFHKSLWIVF